MSQQCLATQASIRTNPRGLCRQLWRGEMLKAIFAVVLFVGIYLMIWVAVNKDDGGVG